MDINPLVPAEAVFYAESNKLHTYHLKPELLWDIEQFARNHACIVGGFRMPKKDDEKPFLLFWVMGGCFDQLHSCFLLFFMLFFIVVFFVVMLYGI